MTSKPALRHINHQKHCSFVIKEGPFDLHTSWHYHSELEIMFFKKGRVAAMMGNRFTEFNEGEMVLLGQDFPHVIFEHSDKSSHLNNQPEGVVIQFRDDFAGKDFFRIPEMARILALFSRAENGIHFDQKTTAKVRRFIDGISKRNSTRQFLDLLEILIVLSEEKSPTLLATKTKYNRSELDEYRMQLVKEYIYKNFRNKIKLSEVAELVSMTETSFCRYYKRLTLKSMTQTLNEIRISYACELLQKQHTNVTEACYQSGFTSPTFFSRVFKKIVGMPPSAYKSYEGKQVIRW
ncbi:helix-turn-helix domain-containing protein [Poritiphilus flavus]|uniref:Helix-turn-helix domain-containing protein n=1 Tax=Poritiphilus flavus TaxID=2697053 RepID=A0A6L9E7P7_9FLAO|nr:AraC family transcriptional regulator [Poritiphilus flavus]NAS10628.1 helix-turn-helix domain-containing protein [Poritiphilus flavus]